MSMMATVKGAQPLTTAHERTNYLLAGCPRAQPCQGARRNQQRGASAGHACRAIRAQAGGDAVAAAPPAAPAAPAASAAAPPSPLVYAGVAFDMDGELATWDGAEGEERH